MLDDAVVGWLLANADGDADAGAVLLSLALEYHEAVDTVDAVDDEEDRSLVAAD